VEIHLLYNNKTAPGNTRTVNIIGNILGQPGGSYLLEMAGEYGQALFRWGKILGNSRIKQTTMATKKNLLQQVDLETLART
jgi:hypothetical protein